MEKTLRISITTSHRLLLSQLKAYLGVRWTTLPRQKVDQSLLFIFSLQPILLSKKQLKSSCLQIKLLQPKIILNRSLVITIALKAISQSFQNKTLSSIYHNLASMMKNCKTRMKLETEEPRFIIYLRNTITTWVGSAEESFKMEKMKWCLVLIQESHQINLHFKMICVNKIIMSIKR